MTNTPITSNTGYGEPDDEYGDFDFDFPTSLPSPAELAELAPTWEPGEIPADGDRPDQEAPELGDHPFWDARPELRIIHDYAKAQMASPHAVVAASLARVIAATPHTVVLPPTVGGRASLNLFVGLVAESGGGKGTAEKVASIAVSLSGGCEFLKNQVVSGEAFTHLYATRRRKGTDGESELVRVAHNALITIGEIDQLAGLRARQGSTIMPVLRSVAMGEHLGGAAATEDRKVWVEALTYRCCLLAGIQPARSGVLFGDSDGGTPQRFLFVAANDPEAELDVPPPSMPYLWQSPDWTLAPGKYDRETSTEFRELRLPQAAVDETRRIALEKNRGLCDPLDGHRNLLRLKVAAGLAILAGRPYMNDEDWDLSDFLMRHSDRQRDRCTDALRKVAHAVSRALGKAEAHRELAKHEEQENALLPAAIDRIRDRVYAAGVEGLAAGMVAKSLSRPQRPYADEAVSELLRRGEIVSFEYTSGNNKRSTRFRDVAHRE